MACHVWFRSAWPAEVCDLAKSSLDQPWVIKTAQTRFGSSALTGVSSALGQERTFSGQPPTSALPLKADTIWAGDVSHSIPMFRFGINASNSWNHCRRRTIYSPKCRYVREPDQMPWTANDAERHTHKATTPALKELWAKVANESLERTGDEGRAIREANAVVARQAGTSK